MSMFLPDGSYQTQPSSGVADITPGAPETTSADIALMQRVFSAASRNVNLIPSDFMAYVVDFIQTSRLQIPIGQVFGFDQFTPFFSPTIKTNGTTSSTTYTDLSDQVGPSLSGLPKGQYLLLFGCGESFWTNLSGSVIMSVSVNGVAASDDDLTLTQSSGGVSLMRATSATLMDEVNSVTCKYKTTSSSTTGNYQYRWLIAIRTANA